MKTQQLPQGRLSLFQLVRRYGALLVFFVLVFILLFRGHFIFEYPCPTQYEQKDTQQIQDKTDQKKNISSQ